MTEDHQLPAGSGQAGSARPFGWGIWSTGTIATKFAEDLAHAAGAARAAVCSRSPETAETFAAAHGFLAHYHEPEAFLADPHVEAVYIASPHPRHRDQALAAIAAGKPVLIEKPIAMTAAEAREIEAAAREAGVFAMEAMWTRFLPAVQKARALIGEGAIGAVERAAAGLVFHRPFDPEHRLFSAALGGGALLDLGVYPISVAAFLFGTPVFEEASWTAAPTGVDIGAEVTMRCGEVPVAFRVGFVERAEQEADNHFFVQGDKGALRIDRPFLAGPSLTLWDRPVANEPASAGLIEGLARRLPVPGRRRLDFTRPSHGLNFQAQAVQAAVRSGETGHPLMPLPESIAAMTVIEQALAAAPAGRRD